ncbi:MULTISPECIES: hypothetical protein [Arthrobacter]|uniref:Uncharacterized protein n=1 Tax=Arthrobacter terricola TaxID=2547396 RepID=A0A4V2ZT37_9MICC|nr:MULTISPECIES: hypothetical protein [Arthrobacter]MBT8161431.1 hypothetical protein [Arthrobacter sp. GN70]TDF95604.1 hypothetical protein E1809_11295 [Arthrobacter terricola]
MTLYEVLEEVRSADRGVLIITKEREEGLRMTPNRIPDDQLGDQYYNHALHKVDDIEPFVEMAFRLDEMSKGGRINDMRRLLAVFTVDREQAAYRRGYIDGGINQITEDTP